MVEKVKAGLLFKSIVQKPLLGEDEEEDSLGRFTRLYLTRFRDNILLEKGCRLEVGMLLILLSDAFPMAFRDQRRGARGEGGEDLPP